MPAPFPWRKATRTGAFFAVNAVATALNHAAGCMAHDQIALAAGSDESRAAREAALQRKG